MFIFLFLILFSCNDNGIYKEVEDDAALVKGITNFSRIGIELIRNATSSEIDFMIEFLRDNSIYSDKNFKIDSFDIVEVVTYSNMPGKTFILDFKTEDIKIEHSLIIVVGLKDEIISEIEYFKVENKDTYSVALNYGSFEFLTAEISKEDDAMLNYNFYNNPRARMSWLECMETAGRACASDGECAFICGIIWQYCIGALVTACTYESLRD